MTIYEFKTVSYDAGNREESSVALGQLRDLSATGWQIRSSVCTLVGNRSFVRVFLQRPIVEEKPRPSVAEQLGLPRVTASSSSGTGVFRSTYPADVERILTDG